MHGVVSKETADRIELAIHVVDISPWFGFRFGPLVSVGRAGTPLSTPHATGDARRPAEAKARELGDAQAIDLTDLRAAGVDERHVLKNVFLRAIAQSRRTANPMLDRKLNVGLRNDGAVGFAGPEIGLGQEIVELIDNQREFVGMIGQTGGMLDHECGAGAVDGP